MGSVLRFDQVAVCPCRVCVADHDVGTDQLTVVQFDRDRFAIFDANACDRGVVADGDHAVFEQSHQGIDDGARAAHGRMHPPALFKDVDQRIHTSD